LPKGREPPILEEREECVREKECERQI